MLPYRFFRHYWRNVLIVSGAVIGAILLEVISEESDIRMPEPEDFGEEEILNDIEEMDSLLRADRAGSRADEPKE